MSDYFNKYLKYKNKYTKLKLRNQIGGSYDQIEPFFDSGKGDKQVRIHLALCEILNFEGINKMNIDVIRKIYDPNVKVIVNGQYETNGVDQQINNIKVMSTMTPDIKITKHDVQFGSGEWTAVVQSMTGTFTGQYIGPNGQIIKGNGNKFSSKVCSIIKWKDNKIIEERVYSDEGNFEKQLGILQCKNQTGGQNESTVELNLALSNKLTEFSNNRNWDALSNLIDDNIKMVGTTGQEIVGKKIFLEGSKQMHIMAPDTKIISTDIQFGSGDWVAVIETMQGTFTKPGKSMTGLIIQPTNKKFKMQSCSLLKWQNGKIIEFRPFWDQKTFADQIGVDDCRAFY